MRKILSIFFIFFQFFIITDTSLADRLIAHPSFQRKESGFVPYHFVDAYYDYNSSLSSGYYNSDIFLTIDSEPNPSSYYYWSKHVWFTDGNYAYMGLQTNGMINGQWVGKMAIFAVWNALDCHAGTKSSCEKFTNEGVGYSCRMKYNWQQGHKYRLRIWYINDSWWAFYIQDMDTGIEDYLGEIKAPSPSMIKSFCLFSEYFMSVNSCEEVPYAKVTFSDPTADNGTYTAKFGSQIVHQTCKNVNFVASDNKLIAETGIMEVVWDADGNKKWSLPDIIYGLQVLTGFRNGK